MLGPNLQTDCNQSINQYLTATNATVAKFKRISWHLDNSDNRYYENCSGLQGYTTNHGFFGQQFSPVKAKLHVALTTICVMVCCGTCVSVVNKVRVSQYGRNLQSITRHVSHVYLILGRIRSTFYMILLPEKYCIHKQFDSTTCCKKD